MADQKCSPGGWTLDTLEKYVSARISELEKLSIERHARSKERVEAVSDSLTAALTSIDKAVAKSEAADNMRYHSLNELRGVLSENIKTLLPRTEYTTNHTALDEKISTLRNVMDEKVAANYSRIDTVQAQIAATDRALAELRSTLTGKTAGIGSVGGVIVGIAVSATAVAAVTSVLVAVFHH